MDLSGPRFPPHGQPLNGDLPESIALQVTAQAVRLTSHGLEREDSAFGTHAAPGDDGVEPLVGAYVEHDHARLQESVDELDLCSLGKRPVEHLNAGVIALEPQPTTPGKSPRDGEGRETPPKPTDRPTDGGR